MEDLLVGTLFFLPAFFGNAAALCVGYVRIWGKPFTLTFDDVLTFGRVELFGSHKTILGAACMMLGAYVVGDTIWALHAEQNILPEVFSVDDTAEGLLLMPLLFGGGVCAGDLAGSFLKRRIGYTPGQDLWVADQVDWFVGVLAVLYFAGRLPSWETVLWGGVVLLVLRFVAEVPRRMFFRK